MLNKSYRLKLAKMLKLYQEVSTDRGLLIAENDDALTAGVEVFIENENGEIVPAPDNVYVDANNKVQYVVEGGTIKEIVEYKDPEETTIEDDNRTETEDGNTSTEEPEQTAETGSDNGSDTGSDTGSDNGSDNGETAEEESSDLEKAKAEIAALTEENETLKRQIADLEKVIAEYREKENFTEPSVEEKDKFQKQETTETEFDKKINAAKRMRAALGIQ